MYDPVITTCKIDNVIHISSVLKGDLMEIEIRPDRASSSTVHGANLQDYIRSYGFDVLMGELCEAFKDVHNFDWYNDRCNGKDEVKRTPKQVTVEGTLYEEVIPEVQRTLVKWAEYHEVSCKAAEHRYKLAKIQLDLSELAQSIYNAKLSVPEILEAIKKIKEENKVK